MDLYPIKVVVPLEMASRSVSYAWSVPDIGIPGKREHYHWLGARQKAAVLPSLALIELSPTTMGRGLAYLQDDVACIVSDLNRGEVAKARTNNARIYGMPAKWVEKAYEVITGNTRVFAPVIEMCDIVGEIIKGADNLPSAIAASLLTAEDRLPIASSCHARRRGPVQIGVNENNKDALFGLKIPKPSSEEHDPHLTAIVESNFPNPEITKALNRSWAALLEEAKNF